MNASECRKRAVLCQQQAARSWGTLQANFLASAEAWIRLADQLDRLAQDSPTLIIAAAMSESDESQ